MVSDMRQSGHCRSSSAGLAVFGPYHPDYTVGPQEALYDSRTTETISIYIAGPFRTLSMDGHRTLSMDGQLANKQGRWDTYRPAITVR